MEESFSLNIRFSRWRKLRLDLSDIFFLFSLLLKHGDFSESRAQRNEVKHTRTMQFSIIFRPRPDSRKIDKARRVALSLVLPIPFQFARNSDDNYSRAREEGERLDE